MLLSPADPGSAGPADPSRHRHGDTWLAAPLAEMPVQVTQPPDRRAQTVITAGGAVRSVAERAEASLSEVSLSEASVLAGGCFVRPLPLNERCASAARAYFRAAVEDAGLPSDLVHDGVTMASELAANTLNAHGNIEYAGSEPVSGLPEFWLYVRSCGSGREIVCKIFDSDPGWDAGEPVPVGAAIPAGPDSVRGRGLQMVAGLSAGRWGHHPSRGRLGAWKLPGKAVWFALRVPPASELASSPRVAPRGTRAIEEIATALSGRGLGAGLVRMTEPGGELAVLSVSRDLTVWCRGEVVWWQDPAGGYDRICVSDLVEATERIVCAHEELLAARRSGGDGEQTADAPAGAGGGIS